MGSGEGGEERPQGPFLPACLLRPHCQTFLVAL